jgi:hypothetical protein
MNADELPEPSRGTVTRCGAVGVVVEVSWVSGDLKCVASVPGGAPAFDHSSAGKSGTSKARWSRHSHNVCGTEYGVLSFRECGSTHVRDGRGGVGAARLQPLKGIHRQ